LQKARDFGNRLGLKFNSTEQLIEKLRAVHFKDIFQAQKRVSLMDRPLGLRPFDFVPSVESSDSLEEVLLPDDPINLMLNGSYRHINIPIIMGTTSNEGLIMVREYLLNRKVFDQYNNDDAYLVPLSFNLSRNSSNVREVAEKFKAMYFNGQNLSTETFDGWAQYHTDAQFKFPVDRTIKMIAKTATQPIYYYNFNYAGGFNLIKNILFLWRYPGACHIDDVFYVFTTKIPIPVWPFSHSVQVRKRHIRLFTNFAKYGNPTPTTDDLITTLWPKYNLENEEFLEIGDELFVKHHHNQERLKVWHEFQKRFTGHL